MKKSKRVSEVRKLRDEVDAFKTLVERSREMRLSLERQLKEANAQIAEQKQKWVEVNTAWLRVVDERDAERRALSAERSEHYSTQSALATVHHALSSRDLVSMYNAGHCVCQHTHDREKREKAGGNK